MKYLGILIATVLLLLAAWKFAPAQIINSGGGTSGGSTLSGNNTFTGTNTFNNTVSAPYSPMAASANLGTGASNGVVTSSVVGADTVNLSSGSMKLVLTANEGNNGCTANVTPTACCTGNQTGTCGLTINAGSLPTSASATNLYTVQFEICQNGTGNFQIGFVAGTGITNFAWNSGGSTSATVGQAGFTLTAGNGDWYTMAYDGTTLRVNEYQSNQPC